MAFLRRLKSIGRVWRTKGNFRNIRETPGDSHLEAVVSPRAEFHHARLLVEGKIFDVDLAGRLINRRRLPLDPTRIVEGRLRRQRHLEVTVGAVKRKFFHILTFLGRKYNLI